MADLAVHWRDTANDSLTLAEAIGRARAQNPRLAAARGEVEAAASRVQYAAAARQPLLRVSGFASRYTSDQRLLPPTGPGQPLVYAQQLGGGDLSLEIPLFLGGRLTQQLRAAERLRDAQSERLERAADELEYQVAATFFGILRQQRLVESIRFSVGAVEAHERTVIDLTEAGKAARVDVLRTQVRLADLRQRLLAEENNLDVQKMVLAYLLAWEPLEPFPVLSGELGLRPIHEDVDAGVAQALSARSDLQAARLARSGQEHRVGAARAARWPAISLQGSFTERWAIVPGERLEGADFSPTLGYLGVAASLPLFDGGRTSAQISEARALLGAADQELRDLEARVRLEVDEAVLAIRSARGRVEAIETAIQQGLESLRIEQEKYRLGKGALTDVLDAQSELLTAETVFFGALADYNIAIARYSLVTGEDVPW
ncbi:MAG: TolC family protein [Gemmatimonadota bacterium]